MVSTSHATDSPHSILSRVATSSTPIYAVARTVRFPFLFHFRLLAPLPASPSAFTITAVHIAVAAAAMA
jgi:hypothetical protein